MGCVFPHIDCICSGHSLAYTVLHCIVHQTGELRLHFHLYSHVLCNVDLESFIFQKYWTTKSIFIACTSFITSLIGIMTLILHFCIYLLLESFRDTEHLPNVFLPCTFDLLKPQNCSFAHVWSCHNFDLWALNYQKRWQVLHQVLYGD